MRSRQKQDKKVIPKAVPYKPKVLTDNVPGDVTPGTSAGSSDPLNPQVTGESSNSDPLRGESKSTPSGGDDQAEKEVTAQDLPTPSGDMGGQAAAAALEAAASPGNSTMPPPLSLNPPPSDAQGTPTGKMRIPGRPDPVEEEEEEEE